MSKVEVKVKKGVKPLKQSRWTKEELVILSKFFSKERTIEEKKEFASSLGRSWYAVYGKFWALKKENKLPTTDNDNAKPEANIKVTHVNLPATTDVVIGDAVVKITASKFRIADVLIEV